MEIIDLEERVENRIVLLFVVIYIEYVKVDNGGFKVVYVNIEKCSLE